MDTEQPMTDYEQVVEEVANLLTEAVLNGAFSETNMQSLNNCKRLANAILHTETANAKVVIMRKPTKAIFKSAFLQELLIDDTQG